MMLCDICGKKAHKNDKESDIVTVTIDFYEGEPEDRVMAIDHDAFECCAPCRQDVKAKLGKFIRGLMTDDAK